MRQTQNHQRHHQDDDAETGPEPVGGQRREELSEDTEATLDEIDDVLEDNAEDFVHAYVQKGGE
ncbi:ubiquitin-like protein Pup [Saccharopolyspora indica]|uniref:ubiquitin-like protein Pup n=1 Tax=Saccharopolyspora indica TaxID=1229659 RepID=UPI0022EB997C|nr:ubiquitin-like protein Pup [Saccharopolyspora indica]MDA3642501.1 ubiquitin-like protein Pup [Saccharopolyspora indica]